MIPVYQTKFLHIDGTGNCINACVASILEMPISSIPDILPDDEGVWFLNWKNWFKSRGQLLEMVSATDPPSGYSIMTVETVRRFPDDHPLAGKHIPHACVAFGGSMIHDPYPQACESGVNRINHYFTISTLN